jgi:SNF2 family DNA or RNA helicase
MSCASSRELPRWRRRKRLWERCGRIRSEGLGWLNFLRTLRLQRLSGRRHGAGQDDAGAGAAGAAAAARAGRAGPSLVVVPRSLVFNWQQEAAKFAPKLRVLDHAHAARPSRPSISDFDMILTTYGTLRNDVAALEGSAV